MGNMDTYRPCGKGGNAREDHCDYLRVSGELVVESSAPIVMHYSIEATSAITGCR